MEARIMPMEKGEYEAIKYVVAAESLLDSAVPRLEKRFKLFPHRWGMIRAGSALVKKAVFDLPYSIEHKKARQLMAELKAMQVEIKFKRIDQRDTSGFTYVDINSVVEILSLVANEYCYLCQKEGAEARHCKLRRAMDGVTTWNIEKLSKDGRCPYDGINLATQVIGE